MNKYLLRIIDSYNEYNHPFLDELLWTTRLIFIQTTIVYFYGNYYIHTESRQKRIKQTKIQYLYEYNSWSFGFRS
jgi:hypothetical protein